MGIYKRFLEQKKLKINCFLVDQIGGQCYLNNVKRDNNTITTKTMRRRYTAPIRETFTPVPEGMVRLKFDRGGRNVEVALDYHRFDLGDYDLILKGVDVNRIKMPEGLDVFKYHINGRRVYSDFTMDELLEIY